MVDFEITPPSPFFPQPVGTKPPKSVYYVFEGTECTMTGRTASKASTLNNKVLLTMYEIEPADKEGTSWKKWVKMDQLFIID